MPEQQVESIPPDLTKAFSDAVFAFGVWSPEQNGRVIPIKRRGLFDQFSVRLCTPLHRPAAQARPSKTALVYAKLPGRRQIKS
jgi:hypothetical protein